MGPRETSIPPSTCLPRPTPADNYSFTGLAGGTYTVRELIPSNELVTSPAATRRRSTLDRRPAVDRELHGHAVGRLGRYSATAIDPNNPGVFWTFQGFDDDQAAIDFNTWGVQATQLAVTNFTTSNDTGVNPETFNIPVTLTDTSSVLTRGGGNGSTDLITATIPVQSTATTIFISFSNGITPDGFDFFNFDPTATGTAIGNIDYEVLPSAANNSYFTTGARSNS